MTSSDVFFLFRDYVSYFAIPVHRIWWKNVLFKIYKVCSIETIDLRKILYIDNYIDNICIDNLNISERLGYQAWHPYKSLDLTRMFKNMILVFRSLFWFLTLRWWTKEYIAPTILCTVSVFPMLISFLIAPYTDILEVFNI